MSTPSTTSPAPPGTREGLSALLPAVLGDDRRLWALALGAMVLDVGLTWIGLTIGLQELNPVAASFITAYGLLGAALILKGGAVVLGYTVWRLLPVTQRAIIPVALGLPSWAAVAINIVTIAAVL